MSEQAEDFVKFESEGRNTHRTLGQEGDRKNLLLNIREQEESEKMRNDINMRTNFFIRQG